MSSLSLRNLTVTSGQNHLLDLDSDFADPFEMALSEKFREKFVAFYYNSVLFW